VLALFVKVSTM